MTIAIITAFCYSVAELYKLTTWNTRFIPVMCALIGFTSCRSFREQTFSNH